MSGISRFRLKKPSKIRRSARKASSPERAGPSVAKEDVNIAIRGKQPREVPTSEVPISEVPTAEVPTSEAKPKKEAGKRLMDFTG